MIEEEEERERYARAHTHAHSIEEGSSEGVRRGGEGREIRERGASFSCKRAELQARCVYVCGGGDR